MATVTEALAIALQHHQVGQLEAAEQLYRQILQVEPNHAEVIHLLGLIAHQVGKYEIAIGYIERAIELNGTEGAFHNNLGEAYRAMLRIPEAVVCYCRALELKPDYAGAYNNLGIAFQVQGKLEEAVACYHRALELMPDFAQAHINLGNTLKDQEKLDEAVACYCRAVELNPDYVEVYNNLGVTYKNQGKLDQAIACYRRGLELKPDNVEEYYNLGNALKDQGKLDEAIACYRRALELKPDLAEAYFNLGIVLQNQGKLDKAIACYHRVLELKPSHDETYYNLGIMFQNQERIEEAVSCYHRVLELKPEFAEAYNNLGIALQDQGKLDEAIACYHRAHELRPDYAEAYSNLGLVLKGQGKLDEAIACYRKSLELKPEYAEAYTNLGIALKDQGKLEEAVACHRRALELKPNLAEAYSNLGVALKDQGNLEEAVLCHRRALELKPDLVSAHDNLLVALQYRTGVTLAALAAAHADYDRQHAEHLRGAIAPHQVCHDRHSRLRLGFISPDLAYHPVGNFLVRVLENLNQEQCEKICYSDRIIKDGVTSRLQAAATEWRDVIGLNDERLAEQVRSDRIDILFDLSGHTGRNRLLVFARKPAPIQITWIGYEGTTGLATMDYLLADRHVVPEKSRQFYREQVLLMPDGYLCYDPPAAAPPVGPLPALKNGYVTFGSFSNPAKITSEVVAVWAEILRRTPTARLVLKYRGLGDQSVQRRYRDLFAGHDVESQWLEFLPQSAYADNLATYHQVDMALDPFPFSGSATTCEALWMGVPVITCPCETFAGRHSLSHLSNVGLTETIARDLDEYIELALDLAKDLPRLAALRARLRPQMAASPLCDGQRFAKNFAALLSEVWQERVRDSK